MHIYKLIFKDNSIYIGKTTGSPESRFSKHCTRMAAGTHHSKKLQRVYDSTKEFPLLEVLEEVSYKEINTREIYWINKFNSFYSGLNGTIGGEGPAIGELNHQAKYTLDDYMAIVVFLARTSMGLKEISKELDISLKVVEHISCGEAHQYLAEIIPEEYSIMISRKGTRKHYRTYNYPRLINSKGIIYEVNNLGNFAAAHGLDNSTLSKLYNGKAKTHKGWKVYNE
jgi:hypothetical protein